ncbi:endo-1,4-beta-xylanase [Balneolaceae bacterium ANBcel3]|nr:endo-1,4-beta-xylanase [Balneolaceae bacterium ANBcel3]
MEKKSITNKLLASLAWSLVVLITFSGSVYAENGNGNGNGENGDENGPKIINVNGSFEDSELGVVEDLEDYHLPFWELYLANGADATFEIVDDPVQEGERALKLTVHELGDNAWDLQVSGYDLYVEAGASYRFSMWARAEESGAISVFSVWHEDFGEFNALRGGIQIPTDEWREYTFDFSVPANAPASFPVRIPVHFSFSENIDKTIYLDNLTIEEIQEAPARRRPVVANLSEGEVGADFVIETEEVNGEEIEYIHISNDGFDISDPSDPDWSALWSRPISEDHVVAVDVTFPFAGEYKLYIRGRVGPDGADADSFYYPDSLRSDTLSVEERSWIIANQMDIAGYDETMDWVTDGGAAGTQTWKWLNISDGNYHADGVTYHVDRDDTTITFHIGGRETGFDMHQIAFGRADLFYTVGMLDTASPGSTEIESDPIVIHPGPPLAEGLDKFLGNIWSPPQLENFENYWNQVTAENAGKWGHVEGTRGVYNWTDLDASYQLARENGWPYRFHVLTWGGQQPNWINDLDSEEQLVAITQWYDTLAARYPDMEYVEVVNEGSNNHQLPDGISGDANYIDALGGTGETGHDWIITAFEMARERFPDSKLMINDYNIVSSNTWGTQNARNYRRIIEDLMERDLIDGIGVQAHAFSTVGSPAQMRAVLDYLAETGLPIQATELDIDGNPNRVSDMSQEESDSNQLSAIQRIFPVFWEHPAVEGITLWGWRPGIWRQEQEAYLVRGNGEERPALKWLMEYLELYRNMPTDAENIASDLPEQFRLDSNYPNPFNPTTQIRYELSDQVDVTLRVYDITGRHVQTLVNNASQTPGHYTVTFDGSNLASGVYLYRLQAGSFVQTNKMMLVK